MSNITPEQIALGEELCRQYQPKVDWLELIFVIFFFWGFALQALIASLFICDCGKGPEETDEQRYLREFHELHRREQ